MLFSVFVFAILLISLIGARNVFAFFLQDLTRMLTGHSRLGLIVYSLLFLPGVIIHEISHFFVAAFLGVQTGTITIFPSDFSDAGEKSLGSVQIAKSDVLRASLIGLAPLFLGSLSIIAITTWQFPQLIDSVLSLEGTLNQLLIEGKRILAEPLNLLWLYLIFAISNTMFVSKSDRRSWPALLVLLVLLALIATLAGISSSVINFLRQPILVALNILTAVFFVSLFVDVLALTPLVVIHNVVKKLKTNRQ